MLVQQAGFGIFVFHFNEQQQHQLGDIVAVVDAVVTQDVAEVPEFLNDVVVGHGVLVKCPDSEYQYSLYRQNPIALLTG